MTWLDWSQLGVNIILIIGGLYAVIQSKRAINQWLIERRGNEKYSVGKKIGGQAQELVKTIKWMLNLHSLDHKVRKEIDERKRMDDSEYSDPRWLLAYWIAMDEVEVLLREIEQTSLECRLLEVDFSKEIADLKLILIEIARMINEALKRDVNGIGPGKMPNYSSWTLLNVIEDIPGNFTMEQLDIWLNQFLEKVTKMMRLNRA